MDLFRLVLRDIWRQGFAKLQEDRKKHRPLFEKGSGSVAMRTPLEALHSLTTTLHQEEDKLTHWFHTF